MTEEVFRTGFAALLNSLPNSERVTPETQAVYYSILREIPDDLWQEGVKSCLSDCTFFPTIHDLGVACCGETKDGVILRCDPWRFKQLYEEKIEAISWQKNLEKILTERLLELFVSDRKLIVSKEKERG